MAAFDEQKVMTLIYTTVGRAIPESLTKDIRGKNLASQLKYQSNHRTQLQLALDKFVKSIKPGTSISSAEVGDCTTVDDVMDLVGGALA